MSFDLPSSSIQEDCNVYACMVITAHNLTSFQQNDSSKKWYCLNKTLRSFRLYGKQQSPTVILKQTPSQTTTREKKRKFSFQPEPNHTLLNLEKFCCLVLTNKRSKVTKFCCKSYHNDSLLLYQLYYLTRGFDFSITVHIAQIQGRKQGHKESVDTC